MFIAREKELQILESEWTRHGFRMPVIYGRRQVGKTKILEKFSEGRDIMMFTPGLELENNIKNFRGIMSCGGFTPRSWNMRGLLGELFEASFSRRVGLIIDEFPYLVHCDPGIVADMQKMIDANKEKSDMFLVLCGSSISFMKDHVLGYESPLFGRRTSQYEIRPFSIFDAVKFFPNSSFMDVCEIYGMVDGTPHYLELMTENNFQENLRKNFLLPSAYMFEEAMRLMQQELRKPDLYHAMLEIISTGSKKKQEILDKMSALGVNAQDSLRMIDNLVKMEIVKREAPLGYAVAKKTLFKIDDLFFRFWHRFIPKISNLVSSWNIEPAINYVEKNYSEYMGGVFEKICLQWLDMKDLEGELPVHGFYKGRWWGNNPQTKKVEEIDIVVSDENENRIFCECKWKNSPQPAKVLYDLIRKSELIPSRSSSWMLFSKNGFTRDCIEASKTIKEVRLVSVENMRPTEKDSPSTMLLTP